MTTDDSGNNDGSDRPDPWNLDEWVAYKKNKAHAFIERGYSVEWFPDAENWMDVYLPERHPQRQPEIRANAKFFLKRSKYGIDGGRISKLSIALRRTDLIAKVMGRPYESVQVLYNYDRGLDVDRLASDRKAKRLYDAVLSELG